MASAASCSFCVAGIFLCLSLKRHSVTAVYQLLLPVGTSWEFAGAGKFRTPKNDAHIADSFLELKCMSAFTLQTADSRYKCLILS
jgi:hypothetical protein